MSDLGDKVKKLFRTTALVAAIGLPTLGTAYSYFVPETVTTKINDVTVKRFGDEDRYLVFTDDGPYKNTAAWYRGKLGSSNMQNDLTKLKGKIVELEHYGWRFQIFHWYENIVEVTEVPEKK